MKIQIPTSKTSGKKKLAHKNANNAINSPPKGGSTNANNSINLGTHQPPKTKLSA